jgi:cytochrome c oxidase cbb3-type subunit 3/ubiquinol-cytochrome c reductase cytochrome c subunit
MGCPQSSDDDAVNGSVPVEGSGSVDSAPMRAPGADEAVEPAVDDGSGSAAEELAEASPSTALTPADSSVVAQGAELYVEYCAFCHGTEGEGYAADNATSLRSQTFLTTADDSFLNAAIVNGRPGTPMSGWGVERGGPLDASQVETLVAFIRQWQTEPTVELSDAPLAGAAGRGRGPYNAFCARCHANDGSGAGAVSLSNPWLLHTASDEYLRYAILQGRDGTEMRDYSDRVSEALANDIVALIRSWQHPVDQDPPPPYEADFDNARLNPDGADPSFELREERFVSIHAVAQALEAGESLVLLDARPNSDFSISHIEGSLNVPFYDVSKYAGDLPRDAWIVAYCGCPHAVSGRAVDALIAEGFTRVAVLDEGFYDWEEAGYSVARAEP